MEKITASTDFGKNFRIFLAHSLHRASFYGVSFIILIYITSPEVGILDSDATTLHHLMRFGSILGVLLGGLIGNFVLGDSKTLFLGIGLYVLGTCLYFFSNAQIIYTGMVFHNLGSGFIYVTTIAIFAKLYYDRPQLLHVAFLLWFLIVRESISASNILFDLLEVNDLLHVGFGLAIFLILLSGLSIYPFTIPKTQHTEKPILGSSNFGHLVIYATLIGILELLIGYQGDSITSLANNFAFYETNKLTIQLATSITYYIMFIFVFRFWLKNYYSHQKKLLVATLASLFISLAVYFIANGSGFIWVIIAQLLSFIALIHITGLALAVVTKLSNPKYLTSSIAVFIFITSSLTKIVDLKIDGGFWTLSQPSILLAVSIILVFALLGLKFAKEPQNILEKHVLENN